MVAQILQEAPRVGRVPRRPVHTFAIRHLPYTIQPFFLAPVLPGETMKNLLLQSRVVTDPLKSALTGWWIEYYFFYVKLRDMDERDNLTQMVLDAEWDPTPVDDTTAVAKHYFAGNGIDWVKLCLKPVVREYFRNDGEAWDAYTLDGMPIASINQNSWLDSATPSASFLTEDVLIDVDATPTPDKVKASDIEKALRTYQLMQQNGLTTQTYEEFLRTYGVRVQEAEQHVPELVRFVRDWSYPRNTVDSSDGSVTSAVSWAIAERADKDRFFSEPGFLFGVSVARPKVYLSAQKGTAAWFLKDAFSWLPAVLQGDARASVRKAANGTGPLPTAADANGYYVDVRDLFVYGDQFCNFDMTGGSAPTDAGLVPLPTTALQKRYITAAADVYALFAAGTPALATSLVRQDGIVTLNILGRQVDTTPGLKVRV